MADISIPGVAQSTFQALADGYTAFTSAVDAQILAVVNKLASLAYVTTMPIPVETLLSDYPASADNVNKKALVTNLYGAVTSEMYSRWDGIAYRWVPQREAFSGTSAATSGVVNLVPLVTPPVLDFVATFTGDVSATISSNNAYIGQSQLIRARGALGVFKINIGGLIGGGTIPLLGGSDKMLVFTAAGWRG